MLSDWEKNLFLFFSAAAVVDDVIAVNTLKGAEKWALEMVLTDLKGKQIQIPRNEIYKRVV